MPNYFQTPTEILTDMLSDYQSITGVALDPTDLNREEVIKMFPFAGAVSMLRAELQRASDDVFPATTSIEGAIKHLATRGLPTQFAAQPSSGVLRIFGTANTLIPSGTQATRALDGTVYASNANFTVGSVGYVDTTFVSILDGAGTNLDQLNQAFTLVVSITGITSACQNQTQFLSGRDLETLAEMQARIAAHDQDTNTGGNLAAYEAWAEAASPAVVSATSIKNARGAGTVNTVITSGTTDIPTAVNSGQAVLRLPSASLIALVQAYIIAVNPTTDDHQTIAPTEASFNVTCTYSLVDETMRSAVNIQLQNIIKIFIYEAAPNETIYPSQLERAIDVELASAITDRRVSDFSGSGPSYTVPAAQLIAPGTITLNSF